MLASVTVNHIDAAKRNGTLSITMPAGPIVVHTEPKQYEYPTLNEYRECHAKLEKCMTACTNQYNRTLCEQQCPICPILLDKKILVQGVNDSINQEQSLSSIKSSLNTTNIIRITNEIHNLIDHHLGNITQNTTNNVHLHQNVSSLYEGSLLDNSTLSCCHVVYLHRSPGCYPNYMNCRYFLKRKRLCNSEHCRAPLMFAKKMLVCEDNEFYWNLYDSDLYSERCHRVTRYVVYDRKHLPRRHGRAHPANYATKSLSKHHFQHSKNRDSDSDNNQGAHRRHRRSNRCHYQSKWPYVTCPTDVRESRSLLKSLHRKSRSRHYAHPYQCQHCYRLSYLHILRYGIPAHCLQCFSVRTPPLPHYSAFPISYFPSMMYPGSLYGEDIIDWSYNPRHNTWTQGAGSDLEDVNTIDNEDDYNEMDKDLFDHDNDNDTERDDENYKDSEKDGVCELLPNGDLIGDCEEYESNYHIENNSDLNTSSTIAPDNLAATEGPENNVDNMHTEAELHDSANTMKSESNTRRRRFTFTRSRYSRRNRSTKQ